MIGVFHHVGIACKNIDSSAREYQKLGFEIEGQVFEDPIQKVRGLFLLRQNYRIELLAPLSDDSPVNGLLSKGVSLYHHAFLCDDLSAATQKMKDDGAFQISGPNPAIAFDMRPVSFFMLRNQNIVELIQS